MTSIERRLVGGLLVGLSLVLAAVGAGIYYSARRTLLAHADARLRTEAMVMVMFVRQDPSGVRMFFNDSLLKEYGRNRPTAFLQAWRQDGTVLKRSVSVGPARLPKKTAPIETPYYFDTVLPTGAPGRAIGVEFTAWVDRRHQPMPNRQRVALVVAQDLRPLLQDLAELRLKLTLGGVATWIALIALVHLLLRSALRPLRRLAARAESIQPHDLARRFPVDGVPRELRPICHRLNALLGRIENSFAHERDFGAALAHELRTPIAELKSLAQVGAEWKEPPNPALYADLEQIADQMERITTHLLTLSRCQSGQIRVQREKVELAPAVVAAIRPLHAKIARRGLELELSVPPGYIVSADRTLLLGVLTNLLSNAVEYSPEHSTVRVKLAGNAAGEAALTVENSAPNLERHDLPRMFERLWRKDEARSSGNGHCGLGLTLVKAYADLLGARVVANLDSRQRLSIVLALPHAPRPKPGVEPANEPALAV